MFRISLTEQEQNLYNLIEFDIGKLNYETHSENSNLVEKLFYSLHERDAFPKQRVTYLNNPEFFIGGRGKSRMKHFQQNAPKGDNLIKNPSFIKYLKYLIDGPNLPSSLILEFEEFCRSLGPITSGDLEPMRKKARELLRTYGLVKESKADAFYQMAIDLNIIKEFSLPEFFARSIYKAINSVR